MLLFPAFSSAQAFVNLKLASPAGEWVGGGSNWDTTYNSTTAGFFMNSFQREVAAGPSFLRFLLGSSSASPYNTFAILDFSTHQLGQPLAVGTYLNATRASFSSPGEPGLDVSWQNRGSNTLTGWFRINRISYTGSSNNYTLREFNADFGQFSDGSPLELTGTITYSSVPEPATLIATATGIALMVRRRRQS